MRDMCNVVFSCGHRGGNGEDGVDVAVKAQDREGMNCIDYAHVCTNCYIDYLENDMILESEVEMDKWMRGNYEEEQDK